MANITRIQNNQITDSTITYAKIASGTLVGTNFNPNLTLNSNVVILGNLTVANSYIQLNSVNTYINDPIVVFNNNYTGSLTGYDIGILVNRNLASLAPYGSVNTFFGWVEADGAFEVLATTDQGTGITSINNTGFANLKAGNTTVVSLTVNGGATILNTVSVGSLQALAIGNVTAGSGAFTSLSSSTTASLNTITGASFQGIIGNATPAAGTFTSINSSTTASLNTITGASFQGIIGNATPAAGTFTGVTVNGTVTASAINAATIGNTGANVNGTGTYLTSLTAANLTGAAPTANVAIYEQLTNSTTNGTFYLPFYDKATGNASAYTNTSVNVNPSTGTVYATTFSGAIAGAGITGTVATANVSLYDSLTNTSTAGTFYLQLGDKTSGNSTTYTVTAANVNPSTGAIYSTSANVTTLNAGGTADIAGVTKITNSTQSTSTSSGALVVTGGVGIGGNLYVSGWSTLQGNVNIGGNLTVTGQSVSIGASTLSITDPIINLNTPQDLTALTTTTTADIGLKFHYYDTADSAAFVGRAVDTGYLEWYSRGTDTANVFAGTVYGTGKFGAMILANAKTVGGGLTANTGVLQVWGDGSVSGNLYVGGSLILSALNNTPIGSTTASTGAFTTLTASSTLGVTGDTSLTTGNIGGLQAKAIGNITPGTGAFTTITSSSTIIGSGNIVAASGTASTNATTGALVVAGSGGVGIGGAVYTGSTASIGGNVTISAGGALITSQTTGYLFNETVTTLNAGAAATTINLGNSGGTTTIAGITKTSGNLVAASGTASTTSTTGALVVAGSGGLGVGGAVYTGSTASIGGNVTITAGGGLVTSQTTGYLFNETATTLNIGSAATTINMGNGSGTTTIAGITKTSGNLVAASGTASTSTTTGALVVANNGGMGVTGNATFGNAVTINSSQTANMDVIVKGKTDATLIWARPGASYDQVVIGGSATTANLVAGAKLVINSNDTILLPVGDNSGRPGSPVTGMFRYSTVQGAIEWWNGSSWQSASTSFTVIADQQFNGTGSQTDFTLTEAQTTNSCIVSINGVVQIPTLAYSVVNSGLTLRFTEAPASTDVIDVRKLTTTNTVTSIQSSNGYMQFTTDNNGAYVYTGTSSTTATTYWDTTGAKVSTIANVSVASANTLTTLDSFSSNSYRTAKYIIQVKNGANYQAQEVLVVTDGTTATQVTYGTIQTSGNLGIVAASQAGSTTTLSFIAANATNTVRISKDYLAI